MIDNEPDFISTEAKITWSNTTSLDNHYCVVLKQDITRDELMKKYNKNVMNYCHLCGYEFIPYNVLKDQR